MRGGHVDFHTLLLLVVAHTVEVVSEIRGSLYHELLMIIYFHYNDRSENKNN